MTRLMCWTIGLALVFGSLTVQAAPICFEDVRSWETVRDRLPSFIQSGEVYGVHSSGSLKGGFRIVQSGRQFFLEIHMKHFLGRYDDQNYLSQVCVEAPTIDITYVNGKTRVITMVEGGVEVKGKVFQLTNRVAYEEMMDRIGR